MKEKTHAGTIIFEELIEMVKDSLRNDIVFFGEKNYLKAPEGNYDLLFHGLSNIKISDIEKISSLVVPVIKKEDQNETMLDVYHEFLKNSDLTKWATFNGQEFNLYGVNPKEFGTEIKGIEYKKIKEKDFFSYVNNPSLENGIREKRRIIDNLLHTALGAYIR